MIQRIPFYNLTNGLVFPLQPGAHFVRIQSTACEQKRWGQILDDLGADFLLHLALGVPITLYDAGHQGGQTRAQWQGVPWILYACGRTWNGYETAAFVKRHNVTGYFREQYNALPEQIVGRLAYFRRYARTPDTDGLIRGPDIQLAYEATTLDGRYDILAERARKELTR